MNDRFRWSKQTKQWEHDCIRARRNLWLRTVRLSQFTISRRDRVLDLGCGDGLNIQLLRRRGVKNIVGVDISGYLLKKARKRNPEVALKLASADSLPFQDNYFDRVLVDSVFHHLSRLPRSVAEIRRVLVPGGKLCFVEPHRSVWRTLYDVATRSPLAFVIPPLFARRQAYLAEQDLMEHWLAIESSFVTSLERKGFSKDFCRIQLLSVVGQYRKK